MTDRELLERALEVREMAYAPYSGFSVGAALLTKDGKVYTGCNIENAAFSPTNCAERTALFKAVSEGEREFTAIAIVGGKGDTLNEICAPCGVCRQTLMEFCDYTLRVILGTPENIRRYTLGELLPFSFGKGDISQ
jgi:cytidine deaminase